MDLSKAFSCFLSMKQQQHSSLPDSFSTMVSSLTKMASGYAKSVKNVAMQYPEIKIKTLEATSNEKWGPTGTQMSELAGATFSYESFPIIMETLWERINDTGKNWRHVYKGLLVLEYLLRCGSPDVIKEARVKVIEIRTLSQFQYIDETGKDHGQSVRQKSKRILELVTDEGLLAEEREKAQQTARKFGQTMSSETSMGGFAQPQATAYNKTSSYTSSGTSYASSSSYGGSSSSYGNSSSSSYGAGGYGHPPSSRNGFGDPTVRDQNGDATARRYGDAATGGYGNAARRNGNATRRNGRYGNAAARRNGNAARRYGNATRRNGNATRWNGGNGNATRRNGGNGNARRYGNATTRRYGDAARRNGDARGYGDAKGDGNAAARGNGGDTLLSWRLMNNKVNSTTIFVFVLGELTLPTLMEELYE